MPNVSALFQCVTKLQVTIFARHNNLIIGLCGCFTHKKHSVGLRPDPHLTGRGRRKESVNECNRETEGPNVVTEK